MPARDPAAPTHITVPTSRSRGENSRGSVSYSYVGSLGAAAGFNPASGGPTGQSADLAEIDGNGAGPILPVHRQGDNASASRSNAAVGSASPAGPTGKSNPSSSNWSRAPGYSHIHTGTSLGQHGYGSFGQRLGQGKPSGPSGLHREASDEGKGDSNVGHATGFMAQLLRRVSGETGQAGNGVTGQDGGASAGAAQPAPMEGGRAGADMVDGMANAGHGGDSMWSAWGSRRGSMSEE
jgi:hypothetical protein